MVQRIVAWVQNKTNRVISGRARGLLLVEAVIVICILVFQYLLLKMLLE